MAKKQRDKIAKLYCLGRNYENVTGSYSLLEYNRQRVLVDFGTYQSNDIKQQYMYNNENLRFSAKEIDAVILTHIHADHSCNIPKLIKLGFKGKIYIVKGSKPILELMFLDCLKIMNTNIELLKKRDNKKPREIYNITHIEKALNQMVEVDYNTNVKITDNISFEFLSNNHMFLSSQVKVRISNGNYKRKIIFTSDLGSPNVNNYITQPLHKITKCDYLIGECTYCERDYNITNETRQKDLEKLCTIIRETCVDKVGKVIIPTFAIQRSQLLLMYLYQIYHNKKIPFKIVLDSPMGVKATKIILSIMEEQNHPDYQLLKDAMEWDGAILIDEMKITDRILNDNKNSYVILTPSGFATAGKVVSYLEYGLPKKNTSLVFCGYSGNEGSIAHQIKSGKPQVNINGKSINNVAKAFELKSFSSHMQRQQLLEYYSNMNTKAIILQHADNKGKYEFANLLEQEINKKNKTGKVYIPARGTVIELI